MRESLIFHLRHHVRFYLAALLGMLAFVAARRTGNPFPLAVAGDVLEAGLAQAKATLGVRAEIGTQAFAELLEKQAELSTQLGEKIRERAQEFSALAAEVQESVGSFAVAATHPARSENGRHAARTAAPENHGRAGRARHLRVVQTYGGAP